MLETLGTRGRPSRQGATRSERTTLPLLPVNLDTKCLRTTANHIAKAQRSDGAIPWEYGGKLDTWNHVEAAMGLTVMGMEAEARGAFDFLKRLQRADGSWAAEYGPTNTPTQHHTNTNFTAYVATGIWHHALVTDDVSFLESHWQTVSTALDFVLLHQESTGHILWAVNNQGVPYPDALVSGCASIYLSLQCGVEIARALGRSIHRWERAREMLGQALRSERNFDRTWPSKRRFAMDWFYPVLADVLSPETGLERLDERWDEFAASKLGCRCVADQNWHTAAETAELVIALVRAGARAKAGEMYRTLNQFRADDGGFWTGYVHPNAVPWPMERTTWTAGAVLLASDSVYGISPGAQIFGAGQSG